MTDREQYAESEADDECKHGLDPRWCATCKRGPEVHPPAAIEATFRAKFPGQCPGCDLPISEGQTIHKLTTGAYVHRGCE